MTVKITLACTECKQRNYNKEKNKKNSPDRLEMKKYCRFCKKQSERRNAGASSCKEKRRNVLCRGKEHCRKNEVPINEDSLGFFPHGRTLGYLFCYKSVWNKRAACIGTMQNKWGLGTAQQAFCKAK